MVSRKWNQQETALPSPVLGGDLTPIDVRGEASAARRGRERSFAAPAQRKRWAKNQCLCPPIVTTSEPRPSLRAGRVGGSTNPAQVLACSGAFRCPVILSLQVLIIFM